MLAIIDGDTLAYKSCPGRSNKNDNVARVIQLNEAGQKVEIFSEEENNQYLAQVWDHFSKGLARMLATCVASDYLMAIKGPDNFRFEVYDGYKKHRTAAPSPNFPIVTRIREICEYHEMAIRSVGREADDLVRIWANQARAIDKPYIICSNDKDLRCIPGMHCNIKSLQDFEVFEVTELEAMRNYYQQLLSGDLTDSIPGVKGIGVVGAKNMVKECVSEEELQELVVGAYVTAYGDDWSNMLLSNGKLIHIQESPDDYFSFKNWPLARELLE
jgi:hypothetical protein